MKAETSHQVLSASGGDATGSGGVQVLNLTINSSIRMDMEWLSSTASTADFQIRLTNTGYTPVKLNALIIRGVHSPCFLITILFS